MSNNTYKEFDDKVNKLTKGLIEEQLERCTEEEKAFFKRLYPKGIDSLSYAQRRHAYSQCKLAGDKHE